MKDRHDLMPILRLAYSTLFLIALMAVFVLWSQVGGQSHLDLLPWWVKLGLGMAAAHTIVRATGGSVSGDRPWNGQTLGGLGVMLAILAACGYATYYAHMNLEESDEEEQQADTTISRMQMPVHTCPHEWGHGSLKRLRYSSVRFERARRLARSAPTSVTTMRSPS